MIELRKTPILDQNGNTHTAGWVLSRTV